MHATAVKKAITNEDIWGVLQKLVGEIQDNSQNLIDFITMSGKKFDKVDRQFNAVGTRFDKMDSRMINFEMQQLLIKTKLQSNDIHLVELKRAIDTLLGEHKAYINDIGDVLDRIATLEERMPNITE